jgi:uncharacterized protein YjbJ (UPF0337 family)
MGFLDKLTGRAKKAAGDLAGDPSLRREGRREERKGEAKEELTRTEERAEEKSQEVSDLERARPERCAARAGPPSRPTAPA